MTPVATALVRAMRLEAEAVVSLELEPVGGAATVPYSPGAHIDLQLGNGLVRSYSLIQPYAPAEPYRLAVLRDPAGRGGSRWVHDSLRVGDELPISEPRNNFPLDDTAGTVVLVAGGIGVTPILCMARAVVAAGARPHVLYGARSRRQAAFVTELEALDGCSIELVTHFDDETGGPPDLPAYLADRPDDASFHCCGPPAMLDAFVDACAALGHERVAVERFAAVDPGPADDAVTSFEVHLARTGATVPVVAGQSILDALLAAGFDRAHSCKEGVCGTCEVGVVEGAIDHRDSVLTAEERREGDTMMICVSGSRASRLVLDC